MVVDGLSQRDERVEDFVEITLSIASPAIAVVILNQDVDQEKTTTPHWPGSTPQS